MSDEPKQPKDAPKQAAQGKGKEPPAQAAKPGPEGAARRAEPAKASPPEPPKAEPSAAQPPPAAPPAEAPKPQAQKPEPAKAAAPKPEPPKPEAKPAAAAAPTRAEPPPPPSSPPARTGALWAAIVVLFIAVTWMVIDRLSGPAADPALAALASRIAAIEGRPAPAAPPDLRPQFSALESRVAAAESRAAAAAALGDRLSSLERALAAAPDGPASDAEARAALAALANRVAQLEARPAAEPPAPDPRIGALAERVAALEERPIPEPDPRVATLSDRVAVLEARPAAEARLAAVEARLAAFVRTLAALEAGRPLGPALAALPAEVSVPASLAAFAERAPPTPASLRTRFAAAARAAREAREPAEGDLLERAGGRIAGLVTVRRGDAVVVGDTTASVLAEAERLLNAGDIAGTIAALDALPPRPAAAMAGWIAEARALLAARDGLAALAAGR